jgi:hypothetical protein
VVLPAVVNLTSAARVLGALTSRAPPLTDQKYDARVAAGDCKCTK